MFTITSIGDSAFLEQILIAVAMITGTGDFAQAAAIGALIGVIIISMQAVFNPGAGLPYQQLLVAWIIYGIAFVPTTTVTIESMYDGDVRVVDDVPFGPAAVGGIMTNLGVGMTELFETAFNPIMPGATVTNSQTLDTLTIINKVHHNMDSPLIVTSLSAALGGADFRASIYNYIYDCSLTKLDLNRISHDEFAYGEIFTVMEFADPDFGTKMNLGGADGWKDYDCKEGWEALETALTTAIGSEDFSEALQDLFNRDQVAQDMRVAVDNSVDLLAGVNTDGNRVMSAMLIKPLYEAAYEDRAAKLSLNNAVIQRNVQGASEASLFLTTVRPLLTFLEGFMYAFSPFLAFVIFFGAHGFGAAKKFLQIQLWIQLWLPIMAMLNLYVVMSAQGELSALMNNASPGEAFASLSGVDTLSMKISHYMGVAGKLGAAVPALSLAILYGGPVALSHLSGRLSGADHFNENNMAPEGLKRGALATADSGIALRNIDSGRETVGAGSTVVGAYEWTSGNMMTQGVQSARGSAINAEKKLHKAYGDALMDTVSSGQEFKAMSDEQHNARRQHDKAYDAAYSYLNSNSETKDYSEASKRQAAEIAASQMHGNMSADTDSKQLGGLIKGAGITAATGMGGLALKNIMQGDWKTAGAQGGAAAIAAGVAAIGAGFESAPATIRGGLGAQVNDQNRSTDTVEKGNTETWQGKLQQALQTTEKGSVSAMEARMSSFSTSVADTARFGGESRVSDVVTSALSEAQTEMQEYKEMSSAQQSVGSAMKFDLSGAVRQLSKDGGQGQQEINDYYNQVMASDNVSEATKQRLERATAIERDNLGEGGGGAFDTIARLRALENATNYDGDHNAHAASIATISSALGYTNNLDGVEYLNTGVRQQAENDERLQEAPALNATGAVTGATITQEQKDALDAGPQNTVSGDAKVYREQALNDAEYNEQAITETANRQGYENRGPGAITQDAGVNRDAVEASGDKARGHAQTLENVITAPQRAVEWLMDNQDAIVNSVQGLDRETVQHLINNPEEARQYLEDHQDELAHLDDGRR
jgi:conjugal transfer mating pair stabilization protein TraG